MNEAVKTLNRVHQSGTSHLDDLLVNLETSAFRLSRLVSALPEPDLRDVAEFDRRLVRDPDGCFRTRIGSFDPAREAFAWIPPRLPLNDREKARFVSIHRLLETYWTGLKGDGEDAYVLGKNGGDVTIWPTHSDYNRNETPETNYYDSDWMVHVRPENNPQGGHAGHRPSTIPTRIPGRSSPPRLITAMVCSTDRSRRTSWWTSSWRSSAFSRCTRGCLILWCGPTGRCSCPTRIGQTSSAAWLVTGAERVSGGALDHHFEAGGARGVVTGIRSETARLMVALGANLADLTTLPTLREAIQSCMRERERDEGRRAVAGQRRRAT